MANEKLLDLLREARESVIALADEYESLMLATETEEKQRELARRIDAALAERQDKPPCSCGQPYPCMKGCPDCCHSQGYLDYCQGDRHAERQDSATDVVESEVEWNRVNDNFSTAYPDDETSLTVSRFDPTQQKWRWDVEWEGKKKGYCTTEDEAKEAAIKAARGLKWA
jgi:hypothetical protein